MTIERGVRKERPDRHGEGTIRSRSRSIGLLYYRGYARKPAQVRRVVPELVRDYRHRWEELREQFREWRSGHHREADPVNRRSGVSTAVATVRASTQCALVVAVIGLACVALALNLRLRESPDVGLRVIIEYYAAFLFFLAVSVVRNGVWGERKQKALVPHDDWLRRSAKESAGAFGAAIVCAWLIGTIGRSLGDVIEAMPVVVVLGGWSLVTIFAVIEEEERYRRRRQRRRRYYSSSYRPRRRRSSLRVRRMKSKRLF